MVNDVEYAIQQDLSKDPGKNIERHNIRNEKGMGHVPSERWCSEAQFHFLILKNL